MKVLAIDIGAGTEDILLYDEEKERIENCVKMVLPSPSVIFAERVKKATQLCKDIFVNGSVIGGGAFAHALREHIKSGLRVLMTEQAAYTVRNDLDEVRSLGIEIIHGEDEHRNFNGETLEIGEVNIRSLERFLVGFGESLSDVDVVAVAVQDHGVFPKGVSNRRFRVQKMKELLEGDPKPENLAFKEDEIPRCFLRMKAAAQAVKDQLPKAKALVMDTSPAAILGCLKDPKVEKANSVLVVNVGNCHTMAAIISESEISVLMEHHTRRFTSLKIRQLLTDFADGKLSDKEVFEDGGHGLFYLSKPTSFPKIEVIAATGPNRSVIRETGLQVHFAAPAGDVMMTGPVGLIEAAKRKFE